MVGNKYGLGIIGLGGMGNWHRETASEIDEMVVVGSYDIRECRQEFAVEKGIEAFPSREALLADERIDIVLVATPNDLHTEIAIAAMRAGKNVVCEKPVCLNSTELQQIIDVSKETGKLFTVHQNRRWDEDFLTIKKMYDEKILGDMFRIESRVLGSRGIPGDWRKEKVHGGGMVLDWGVHLLDQALMMIPEKVKKVYADLTYVISQEVDDGMFVDLTFESGLVYHVEVGTNNFINLPRWYALGIDGSATLEWDLTGRIVKVRDALVGDAVPIKTAAGLTKTMAPRLDDSIGDEEIQVVHADIKDYYRNVMDTLSGKAEINITQPQVMRVMKLMEAIFKSSETKQVVDFE